MRKRRWGAVGLGMMLTLAASVAGQASTIGPPLPGASDYVHEVFGAADGLPVGGISQILQTRDGHLWFGTFDGLARFDGVRFEVFDSDRVPALGSNRVVDLLESRDGTLWIRSEQGHVARFSGGVFTACGEPRAGRRSCALSRGTPFASLLHEDRGGVVWIGGRSGLFRVAEETLEEVPGLAPGAGVSAVLVDRGGRLWVGTRRGLLAGRSGRLSRVPLPPGWDEVLSLAEDPDGGIWVSSPAGVGRVGDIGGVRQELAGRGYVASDEAGDLWVVGDGNTALHRYRGGRLELIQRGPGDPLRFSRNIRRSPSGDLWLAWDHLYRNGNPVLTISPPLAAFTSVVIGREGTIWVATGNSGVLHALHPARLTTILEGLPNPILYPVHEDRDGSLWVGGADLLARLAPGAERFEALPGPPGTRLNVQALLRDRAGTFWVGNPLGLFIREPGGFVPVPLPERGEVSVQALFEDSRGAIWAGAGQGLYRRDPRSGAWSKLPIPTVRVIREAPDGALWLGTNGGGVVRLAGGRVARVTTAQGLSSDLVRALYLAPDGVLWIGTENAGLNRLDPATVGSPGGPRIAVIGRRQGLPVSGLHQIVPDGLGNLWMSSNQGIFRARLRDLEAVAGGRQPALEAVLYTERDGMLAREANGGGQNAGLRDRSGRIWFPTQRGLVRVDPRAVLGHRLPPLVQVRRLRAGGEEIPLGGTGEIRLNPQQRSFAFELAAPSFRSPGRQRFRYRLTPYDRDWIEAGADREASYTKVPPGSYTFEVLASSSDGVWSDRPARVSLEVVPRFFETVWFRAGLLIAVLAAVAAATTWITRLRQARFEERQRELEQMVQERTATIAQQAEKLREVDSLKSQFFANVSHELRTPLTLILGPLRDALDGRFGPTGDEMAGQLELASRNTQRLLGLVDQLLDLAKHDAGQLRLKVRRGDLAALLRQRVESFLPLAERCRVELSLRLPEADAEFYFDAAELEKVFDNLLSNALKFTPPGGRVTVALAAPAASETVEVTVQDSGPGIPAEQADRVFDRFYQVESADRRPSAGVGLGLALARHLVELHGGSIAVTGREGEGACFTVTLRRGRDHFPAELVDEAAPTAEAPSGSAAQPPVRARALPTPLPPLPEPRRAEAGSEDERMTVLVVDDNADIRAYVRRHLEPDYRVVEAAGGAEALEQARRAIPDLVISDIMMPGIDGHALYRALREDPELELVPVILLTAKASPESRLQGLRDGADDYLIKPFDPWELKARVDNLIASRRRLAERLTGEGRGGPRPLRAKEIEATPTATPADEAFVARAQAVIEERLGDPELTVEALAAALRCDRSYLLRKLRALTGESPSDLIRSLRLQRAEQLLKAGAGTVGEIAYAVGFKSVAHFSNAFHQRYGERPSAFALRHRSR